MNTDWNQTLKALGDFGELVVKDARKNLVRKGKNTGKKSLSNSLESRTVEKTNSIGVQVLSLPYSKFVDKGVKGHMREHWKTNWDVTPGYPREQRAPQSEYSFKSPAGGPAGIKSAFKNWFRIKPFRPRDQMTGQYMSYDDGAFLMSRATRNYGLKPSYYMRDAIDKNLPKLIKDIEVKVSEDIIEEIDFQINKIY